MADYAEFLENKRFADIVSGFECEPECSALFDFQRVIVKWALHRGRAAVFADTGLGKTLIEASWSAEVARHTGRPVLNLAPLSVAHQTTKMAAQFGIDIAYHRSMPENPSGIIITNYEMLDHFDLSEFSGIVLDESSILKSFDGKTRTKIIEAAKVCPYRLSATATPSPNDFMELGNQSEFLGIMSRTEMLAMFFIHDGGSTSNWRLKGHGQDKFWEWLSTWAVVIRKPSDLGFDDARYNLPPLRIHEHIVETENLSNDLFGAPAMTLSEQRTAKRASLQDRVDATAALANADSSAWLIWCHLNDESAALNAAIPDAIAVAGSDSIEHKERSMDAFSDSNLRALVSKPSICGFGMNWQHCNNIAFAGLDHSFEQFYQAVRRCWRFGQTKPVDVHIFLSDAERPILLNIRRKEKMHEEMSSRMVEHMRNLMRQKIMGATMEKTTLERETATGEGWTLRLGDCVEEVENMEDNSIHYTVFSPPFASLYTYSNSDRDMGNSSSHQQFYDHFQFLVSDLLRVTKPGRLLSFHCMNLPTSKQNDGYIGLRDFRGELIRMFVDAGWIYHSEVCIWKDPVTAMQRTKALGLLHKQIKKDSCMSRQGIADYLVTMRKPGENPEPVTNTNESFPVHVWQRHASPVWTDINASRTLQYREARENDDERHICPLQLDVIERAINLWSNAGDTVLSPFAGIGSEGHVALQMARKFVGVELKRSYWNVAKRNLEDARRQTADLFASAG